MFDCKKCQALEAEVSHLRVENLKLIDRLTAIADMRAYGTVHMAENRSIPVQDEDDFEQ
jgi:hypothetical protein